MVAYLLNLADLFLTLHALSHGGVELNPLLQSLPVMVAWKVVGVGVLCYALQRVSNTDYALPNTESVLAWRGLRVCSAAFAAACINNLIFIIFGGA